MAAARHRFRQLDPRHHHFSMSRSADPVFSLVYVSRETSPMRPLELHALLDQARRNNLRLGITGLLVYKAGHFLQVLEGAQEDVESLMGRIRADLRHKDVTILLRDGGADRRFGDWSMALADWPDEDAETSAMWFDLLEAFRTGRGRFGPSGNLIDFISSLARHEYLS